MEEFGDGGKVAGEVSFRPFWYTFAAPCDENVLGQTRVGICHLHVGKLHSTFGEFFDEIFQFTIYGVKTVSAEPITLEGIERETDLPCFGLSGHSPYCPYLVERH